MATAKGSLPPPPVMPHRKLTPPARRYVSGTLALDDPTPAKSEDWTHYSAFVSVAETLTSDEQQALIELVYLWGRLDGPSRHALMVVARGLEERK